MNTKFFLIKNGFLKLKPKFVQKAANQKNLDVIEYSAREEDFWCRREAAKALVKFDGVKSIPILKILLHDKVFTVAEYAIESLHNFDLSKDLLNDINTVLDEWEERARIRKENWQKPVKSGQGLYIDKTKMKRLKELKALLAKPKGSMSIG